MAAIGKAGMKIRRRRGGAMLLEENYSANPGPYRCLGFLEARISDGLGFSAVQQRGPRGSQML
jgi:hypothetical protein